MNKNENKEVLLSVKNLTVHYITKDLGTCCAVNDVSFELNKGETLGLVGETGAGKTSIALSILRLLPKPQGHLIDGTIIYKGSCLNQVSEHQMQKIRGEKISMVFQDPMTALNPIDTIGEQVAEVIRLHQKVNRKEALERAIQILEKVGIPGERYNEYPHQFSGGMKQRVVIAIALACSPELLIADEPTTALDVTIQAQVLEMMNRLKEELGTSLLLITHDLGVVAEMCDCVAVVYAGEIVEYGSVRNIFKEGRHPYTIGLFESLPSMTSTAKRLKPIRGMMPDPSALPKGCKFAPRCDYCSERCKEENPPMLQISENHFVKCFLGHERKEF